MIANQLHGGNRRVGTYGNQINIQDNAFEGGNLNNPVGNSITQADKARRRNFFEKKRFINNPYSNNDADNNSDTDKNNMGLPADSALNNGPSFIPGEQRRGAGNANALN